MRYVFLAMRPHQWLKNLFIFLPVLFGGRLTDAEALFRSAVMFAAFCLVSSAVYLVNDIMDAEEDKRHPEKALRPFASRRINFTQSVLAAAVLLVMGLASGFTLGLTAGLILTAYILLNYLYMSFLKNAVIIDVFCIGGFFYLRVLSGGVVNSISLSGWIIMCTVLLALFLAFNKRRYDLRFAENETRRTVFTRYTTRFIDQMVSIVSSSVIICYALYSMDARTVEKFGSNHLIYTVPFVYYGIFRYLYLVDLKEFAGDPSRVLSRDFKMQLNLILWAASCIAVVYFKI